MSSVVCRCGHHVDSHFTPQPDGTRPCWGRVNGSCSCKHYAPAGRRPGTEHQR